MDGEATEPDPLGIWLSIGYRVAWLDDFDGAVWVVDGSRVLIADSALSRQTVSDALWSELHEQLRA